MSSILLVSPTQSLSARVPEILHGCGHEITVVGAEGGQLLGSPFIRSYEVVCARTGEFVSALEAQPDLLARGSDWVLYDDDALVRALARGTLPLALKRSTLPASTDVGLGMLGSKVGQQVAAEVAGVVTPRSVIAHSRSEVERAISSLKSPVLVKADIGGGGAQVWLVRDRRALATLPDLDDYLPVVVQEFIRGRLISVEPLFRRGQLLGFTYSEMIRTMAGGKGPSTVRRYMDPPTPDVRESLEAIGAGAGAHGFANVTYMWRTQDNAHLMIECDLRINTWVQHGPQLGVDWGALMGGPESSNVATTSVGSQGRVIHLYPRALRAALSERSWSLVTPWLRSDVGTWEARNTRDPVVNAAERASLLSPRGLAFVALHDPLRARWNQLPSGLRRRIEGWGWKHRVLRSMGIHLDPLKREVKPLRTGR